MHINSKNLTKLEDAINVLNEVSNEKANGLYFYKDNIKECLQIIANIRQKEIEYSSNYLNNKLKRRK